MKKLIFITIVIAFFLFFLTACGLIEFNYKRTIWINPDVECCGVKDPINNLEWLKEYYEDSYFNENNTLDYQSYGFIYVFENDSSLESFVVTRIYQYNDWPCWFQLYTCEGKLIEQGFYFGSKLEYANSDVSFQEKQIQYIAPRELDREFFNTHTLLHIKNYSNIL